MSEQEFENLIKKDKYQVFIFTSWAHIPFIFAMHPWFVINKKGVISRYEIVWKKNCCEGKSFGHLHLNAIPPWSGIGIFSFSKKHFWKSKLLGMIEGDENSHSCGVMEFIENSKTSYPYLNKYVLTGPNSNTYAQWILDKFPEFNIKLPWSCIGKAYKTIV